MKYCIVGTAGHIDHGKTELVKALTGIDTDRLKEEKERGITIDLGFASMELNGATVSFIDVPGHEDFVNNMLAGIGGIDLMFLVVAADESVKPQTIEHFQICRLLEIQRGIVVLTKIDRVDEEMVELVKMEIADLVVGSAFEGAPVVPVCAPERRGLDQLRPTMAEQIQSLQPRDRQALFRLPVDRVFTMRGFGTVVTGTAFSGSVRVAESIEIFPTGQKADVRGLQSHNASVEEGVAGMRLAMNLKGVEKDQIERGYVVSTPYASAPSNLIDCRLTLLENAPEAMSDMAPVRFHHGAAEIIARIKILEKRSIEPGETVLVQLRLEQPYAPIPGDRFIIRRYSPMVTIGGGVVLDNMPAKHRGFSPRPKLASLDPTNHKALMAYIVRSRGALGADGAHLRCRTGWQQAKLLSAQSSMSDELRLLSSKPLFLFDQQVFDLLKDETLTHLANFHIENPLLAGLEKSELKSAHFAFLDELVFEHVLRELREAGEVNVTGNTLALGDFAPRLEPEQVRLKDKIEEAIQAGRFAPPTLSELQSQLSASAETIEQLFHLLLQEGKILRITESLLLHRDAYEDLLSQLRQYASENTTLDVSQFKDLTQTSRKYAIPLLEYLDRQRITRREGNQRVILLD